MAQLLLVLRRTVWWQVCQEAAMSQTSMPYEGQVEGSAKDSGNFTSEVTCIPKHAVVSLTPLSLPSLFSSLSIPPFLYPFSLSFFFFSLSTVN